MSDRANSGIVSALQSVSDGVVDLAKSHLDLAKAEARNDLDAYAREAAHAAVGLGLALVGYLLFMAMLVCVAAVAGGIIVATAVAGLLGLLHIVIGVVVIRNARDRIKARGGALPQTRNELRRSTEWVTQSTTTETSP